MNDIMETIEYKGYDINIIQDDISDNPREWDNLGEIVGYCRRYELYDVENPYAGETGSHIGDFKLYLDDQGLKIDDVIYLPVSAYIHSGVSLSIGEKSGWDSGQVGYIYATKKGIRDNFMVKNVTKKLIEHTIKILENEIETFGNYVSGEVYGFEIVKDGEVIDSLSGFYGYDNEKSGLLCEAQGIIDCEVEYERKKRQEKTKVMIKNNVPLAVR